MSDAAVTALVTGLVSIATMVIGFLKLRDEAAKKARAVEAKIDDNTRTTEAVDAKADVIVEQTNGVTTALQTSVDQLLGRVEKLEAYNREASHRVLDAVHAMHLKLAAMGATQPFQPTEPPPQPSGEKPS